MQIVIITFYASYPIHLIFIHLDLHYNSFGPLFSYHKQGILTPFTRCDSGQPSAHFCLRPARRYGTVADPFVKIFTGKN